MQQEDAKGETVTVHPDQLVIDVPPSGGIARFTADDEIAAYREQFGEEATRRQLELAKKARECSCGKQRANNEERAREGLRPRKLKGNMHLPGCPQFVKIAAVRHQATEAEVRKGF